MGPVEMQLLYQLRSEKNDGDGYNSYKVILFLDMAALLR
jgi:hypothetical protein